MKFNQNKLTNVCMSVCAWMWPELAHCNIGNGIRIIIQLIHDKQHIQTHMRKHGQSVLLQTKNFVQFYLFNISVS